MIRNAIVKIFEASDRTIVRYLGTGFVIGRESVVTCAHVVKNLKKSQLLMLSNSWDGAHWEPVGIVKHPDPKTDVALLQLPDPIPKHSPIVISVDHVTNEEVTVLGFAHGDQQCRENKRRITNFDGRRHLSMAEGGEELGMSGSPVLVGNRLIAITHAAESTRTYLIPTRRFVEFVKNTTRIGRTELDPTLFTTPRSRLKQFFGRHEELQQIRSSFNSLGSVKGSPIAAIIGQVGVGKTALAVEYLHRYKSEFPDGIIGINVEGKSNDAIAREIAGLARIAVSDELTLEPRHIVEESLRNKRILLVLDGIVTSQLDVVPIEHCHVLLTSFDGGIVHRLTVHTNVTEINLRRLNSQQSLSLFEELLGAERTERNHRTLRLLHQRVGGLPLALMAIAAIIQNRPDLTISQVQERLLSFNPGCLNG